MKDMQMDKQKPTPSEPVGTPPAGGSWYWADGQWKRTDAEQARPEINDPSEE